MSQAITYPDIPGIKWVYNRSNKQAEVQWDLQVIELPAHTVTPLPDPHARQALAKGTYKHYGTSEAESFLVLAGMAGFAEPPSEEDQAYLDGDDPLLNSRITLKPENDVIYGKATVLKVTPDAMPGHMPAVDPRVSVSSRGKF